MIISRTPLRISFAGGGTDLPSFYKYNDYGAVLSTSINSYLYVSIKKHSPLFGERYRLNYSHSELLDDLEKIKNNIIRECLKFTNISDRIYISTIADAPESSGLGSSSSFCVGLLNAIYKYKGEIVSNGRLADEAAHIEIDILKRPMGKQDHYAAAFGGLNYIHFNDDDSVDITPIITKANVMKELFSSLLSFWTGVSRPSESILKEQDEKHKVNTDVLIAMRKQAEILSKLLTDDKFSVERFGKIINEGWKLKRILASNISNSIIDNYYSNARLNGAIGGKISGAGGGGFLNLFAPETKKNTLITAMKKLGLDHFPVGPDMQGTIVISLE